MLKNYDVVLHTGPFPVYGEKQAKLHGLDPQVLVDALSIIMGHEEKELCKPGHLAMVLILDTATNVLGSKERVSLMISLISVIAGCWFLQWSQFSENFLDFFPKYIVYKCKFCIGKYFRFLFQLITDSSAFRWHSQVMYIDYFEEEHLEWTCVKN